MVDDQGAARLEVELDEPSRLDVDRDPLYVMTRLEALVERGLAQLHDQALKLNEKAWPRGC